MKDGLEYTLYCFVDFGGPCFKRKLKKKKKHLISHIVAHIYN